MRRVAGKIRDVNDDPGTRESGIRLRCGFLPFLSILPVKKLATDKSAKPTKKYRQTGNGDDPVPDTL